MRYSADFKQAVFTEMAKVPKGKVVSYGQLALYSGHPGAARAVGQIAHFGPPDLPWHRLVHASGKLANGYVPGGPARQRQLLCSEGIRFYNNNVIMRDYQV